MNFHRCVPAAAVVVISVLAFPAPGAFAAASTVAEDPVTIRRIDLVAAAELPAELLPNLLDAIEKQLGKPGIDLKVTILDASGEPFAERDVRLMWSAGSSDLRTDAAGKLTVTVTKENHAGIALLVPESCRTTVVSTIKVGGGGAGASSYANAAFKPGDTIPALKAEIYINAQDDFTLDWEALGDRVVVLEFWATWCAPCIAAIPHMNDLVEQFADRGVLFLSVTDEGEDLIRPFLEKHPMKGVVALDTDRSILKDFKVQSWPQTHIIKGGKLLASMHPMSLKPAMLEAAIAGEPISRD